MPGLKPAYLISGDDDAKIDAWRARVRHRAEEENGPGGLEIFDATSDPPEAGAIALTTLTFATGGDRYLLADNVEAWKAGDLDQLEREIGAIPDGTVLVLIARGKPPLARLVKAIEKAGGEHREYSAPKPWQMPKWAAERAREEGLNLDQEAAKALVAVVGTRQQRLAREVERLAILAHPRTQLTAEEVTRLAAGESSQQAYDLADALVAGDVGASLGLAERLTTSRDDRPAKLVYPIGRRLRALD